MSTSSTIADANAPVSTSSAAVPHSATSNMATTDWQAQPNVVSVILFALSSVILVAAAFFFGAGMWEAAIQSDAESKAISFPNTPVGRLKAEQAESLTDYQWADKGAGTIRIPLDRAMELTIERLQAASMTGGQ